MYRTAASCSCYVIVIPSRGYSNHSCRHIHQIMLQRIHRISYTSSSIKYVSNWFSKTAMSICGAAPPHSGCRILTSNLCLCSAGHSDTPRRYSVVVHPNSTKRRICCIIGGRHLLRKRWIPVMALCFGASMIDGPSGPQCGDGPAYDDLGAATTGFSCFSILGNFPVRLGSGFLGSHRVP